MFLPPHPHIVRGKYKDFKDWVNRSWDIIFERFFLPTYYFHVEFIMMVSTLFVFITYYHVLLLFFPRPSLYLSMKTVEYLCSQRFHLGMHPAFTTFCYLTHQNWERNIHGPKPCIVISSLSSQLLGKVQCTASLAWLPQVRQKRFGERSKIIEDCEGWSKNKTLCTKRSIKLWSSRSDFQFWTVRAYCTQHFVQQLWPSSTFRLLLLLHITVFRSECTNMSANIYKN